MATPNLLVDRREGDWRFMSWDDGCQQWSLAIDNVADENIYLERVLRPGTRRRRWHIVKRAQNEHAGDWRLYPPVIAGPFATTREGLDAYETYLLLTQ